LTGSVYWFMVHSVYF